MSVAGTWFNRGETAHSVVLRSNPSISLRAPSQGRDFPSAVTTPRKRSTRRRGRGPAASQLTSTSTSRTAYAETKRWLIQQHGPVCAYCGRRVAATTITLDHVAPRRGQSAYDRRDNLVLACADCNGAKADMPILAFLLRKRERALMLRRYGAHLSPMLVDLVRALAPDGEAAPRIKETFEDLVTDDESPYHESPYRE
jgi:5-methylcytosine-specific restriction endonuclease McrA